MRISIVSESRSKVILVSMASNFTKMRAGQKTARCPIEGNPACFEKPCQADRRSHCISLKKALHVFAKSPACF